jgi:hypothetical protein
MAAGLTEELWLVRELPFYFAIRPESLQSPHSSPDSIRELEDACTILNPVFFDVSSHFMLLFSSGRDSQGQTQIVTSTADLVDN